MHALAVFAGADDACTAQIRKVTGYFGLRLVEDLNEIGNGDLLVARQVQQPEAGAVTERLKESNSSKVFFAIRQLYMP